MTTQALGWLAHDTETFLTRPGVQAPELVCLTTCYQPQPGVHPEQWPASIYTQLDEPSAGAVLAELWSNPQIGLTGFNTAFDAVVAMANDESIIPAVFAKYKADLVRDCMINQQLLDIAAGRFRKELKGLVWKHYQYNLDETAQRSAGMKLDKSQDSWRLKYHELHGVPLAQWPEAAVKYPLDDTRATLAIDVVQQGHAGYLEDQYRQARRALAMALTKTWGLRTHAEGVARFEAEVDAKITEVRGELIELGLVRPPTKAKPEGSRDTKAAARLMLEVCKAKGLDVLPTDGMAKKVKFEKYLWDPWTKLEGVALDEDSCLRVDDPRLTKYAEYVKLIKVKSTDIEMLLLGTQYPIHTRYDIVETGRTSSSAPNVQNIRRLPGIRECFIPRPGHVFFQADYPQLELRTLAQACVTMLGRSALAIALNSGMDPHIMLACNILHISYEEGLARRKSKDKTFDDARQAAKVANFGFPGGLGYAAFVDFARAQYRVILTLDEAKALKANWLATWPEMKDYFRLMDQLCQQGGGTATIQQLFSNRWRGNVKYTALCNTWFQGLGADATGDAWFRIIEACYNPGVNLTMLGARIVNFVHDEFIGETPYQPGHAVACPMCKGQGVDSKGKPCMGCAGSGASWLCLEASARAKELSRLMWEGANLWLPDVPFTLESIEPVLMSHWSKNAATMLDEQGNVLVWMGDRKVLS